MPNEVSRQVSIEKNFDHKLIINAIICLMLESQFMSDDDNVNTGDSESKHFEPKIKHLAKGGNLTAGQHASC